MNAAQPVRILLVEDSSDDVILTKKALRRARVANDITVADTGERALTLLREGMAGGQSSTDLVLLDLNLPGMNGHEVLEAIKTDDDLRHLPVIVLTTSGEDADIQAAYRRCVNAYVCKPLAFDQFTSSIRAVEDFWLSVVRLPGR